MSVVSLTRLLPPDMLLGIGIASTVKAISSPGLTFGVREREERERGGRRERDGECVREGDSESKIL